MHRQVSYSIHSYGHNCGDLHLSVSKAIWTDFAFKCFIVQLCLFFMSFSFFKKNPLLFQIYGDSADIRLSFTQTNSRDFYLLITFFFQLSADPEDEGLLHRSKRSEHET